MPINDSKYQDALDYFYESESDSENEYFRTLESEHDSPRNQYLKKVDIRVRRERSQREAQIKLARIQAQAQADAWDWVEPWGGTAVEPGAWSWVEPEGGACGGAEAQDFHPFDMLARLPSYIPPFNDRTVSAETVFEGATSKAEKRWRGSTGNIEQSKSKKGASGKSKTVIQAPPPAIEEKKWKVDQKKLATIEEEGATKAKYQEFISTIVKGNYSPLDPRFEKSRWDLKKTKQKEKYILYSIRLSGSHRATFMVDEKEKVVIILSAGKHA
ncbi:hypothetical protein [Rahnella woolbedingensis]|uniref:Uncharacterized protein n=1 Tax=Rahnella woolbedingensis TaxID=1510574 RepID=A0A419N6F8_9GAMM|nr:hypothetical protein [Rahnella woolbedingensis]RJT42824.1 hypothetical protein D6C13_16150 [Rahnella woolbedingensis]